MLRRAAPHDSCAQANARRQLALDPGSRFRDQGEVEPGSSDSIAAPPDCREPACLGRLPGTTPLASAHE